MSKPLLILTLIIAVLLYAVSASLQISHGDAYELDTFQLLNMLPRLRERSLVERDICTNANPNSRSQTCAPGSTLCCSFIWSLVVTTRLLALGVPIDTDIAFSRCEELFGIGFCCVSEGGACYQDIVSDCSTIGAVQCSESTQSAM